jgi:hypothetical protein
VDESIEKAVVDFSLQKPAYGQLRVCNELKKQGVSFRQEVCVLFGKSF